jgi:hypothetical protein
MSDEAVQADAGAGETDAGGAEATPGNAQAQAAAAALAKKLATPVELKFKGKVEKVDDLDQLARWAQMGRGATEVFESAKKLREEAEAKASRLERLKGGSVDDRLQLLAETMGDEEEALRFMEEALYAKRVAPQQLSPEQRQMLEMQRQLQAYKSEKEQTTKAQQEAELERQADAIAQQYARTASDIMQRLGWGAELAPLVLRRLQPYAEQALEAGMEPISEDIMQLYLQDEQQVFSNMVSKLDGDTLLRFLGDEVANKVRKADLARLRGGGQKSSQAAQPERQAAKPVSGDSIEDERARQKRRRDFWSSEPFKR